MPELSKRVHAGDSVLMSFLSVYLSSGCLDSNCSILLSITKAYDRRKPVKGCHCRV